MKRHNGNRLGRATSCIFTLALLVGHMETANADSEYDAQAGLALINVQRAYDKGLTGAGILVGVADSGISLNHPEFAGRDFVLKTIYNAPALDDDWKPWINPDKFPVDDSQGHGSHVSGIIAARRDAIGMHGVAYDARLVVAGIGDAQGRIDRADEGLRYLVQSGAKVINNSWGSSAVITDATREEAINEPLLGVVREAVAAGTLMVWATGNSSKNQPSFQAGIPYLFPDLAATWVAVNALTLNGEKTNYGNNCGVAAGWCISAPGGDSALEGVFSVNVPGSFLDQAIAVLHQYYPGMSPAVEGNYVRMSGTSMATPHVSGALAVLIQAFPYLTAEQIKMVMFTTATDIGAPGVDDVFGWGLLNLGKAVDGPGQLTFTWQVDTQGLSSTWRNDISGTGGLTKTGGGTLTLTGANTYVGPTLISGGRLLVNGSIISDSTVMRDGTLGGTGQVGRVLVKSGGTLAPGNSPGTLLASGSVVQEAGSNLAIEIDGTGTGNGAGNYDRLVLTGVGSTYTAGGSFNALLRGIGGSASNTYSPPLGQGFQVVSAPGGLLGSFDTLLQPPAGLLPGTRFDLVYGATGLALYATPSSYADIGAAGVVNNRNRQQVGAILEGRRPGAGRREGDPNIKRLFDALAAQSAPGLTLGIDQLGGVGYAQLIGMNLENSKFLVKQTLQKVARQRRGESHPWSDRNDSDMPGELTEEAWGEAIGRTTRWHGDDLGYGMNDTLLGLMGGFHKKLDAQTLAGISMAYAESNPALAHGVGRGPQQSFQLMGYASHRFGDGYFLEGAAGGGAGRIDATRRVGMLDTQYQATIDTANVAASVLTGWGMVASDAPSYEISLGVGYLSMRSFGFSDTGNQPVGALRGGPTTNTSLAAAIGGSVSMPFMAYGIDWRISGRAGLSHEFADSRTRLDASFLGKPIEVKSSAIGRNRLSLGASLVGQIGRLTHIALDVGNESASNWNASSLTLSVKRAF